MSSIRRRDFLKGALAASAVGVAPFNILKAGPSPNSKLNIACIGVGGMGSSDASYLASSDNVIALCDVDEARHKRCIAGKKNLHGIKFWKDYRVMFDKIGKEIDAIHTATPDHARFAVSMFAMRRGKHVYAQKPLCHTVNEARVLTEEARRRKVITQMGHQGHSTEGTAMVRDWVQGGCIGDVRGVIAYSRKNYWTKVQPVKGSECPKTLEWDLFLNRAETIPFSSSYMNREWIRYSHFSGIYMEKPLCRTLEEADQMAAACRKHNVKLTMAHQSQYVPKMKVIQEIIRSGKMGRLLELCSRCKEDHRGGPIGLWVEGTRVLAVMQALAGNPLSCFGTVLQNKRPITKQDIRDCKSYGIGPLAGDEVHAMYRFNSGATGYFDSVRRVGAPRPWRFGLWIFGSGGVLHWSNTELFLSPAHFLPDPLWCPGCSGKKWIPVSSAGIGTPEPLKGEQSYHAGNVLAVKDLIASIEEDRQPLANLEEARTNLEMIVAVFESHRVGGLVSLPMKNRKNPLTMLKG